MRHHNERERERDHTIHFLTRRILHQNGEPPLLDRDPKSLLMARLFIVSI